MSEVTEYVWSNAALATFPLTLNEKETGQAHFYNGRDAAIAEGIDPQDGGDPMEAFGRHAAAADIREGAL